MKPRLVFAILAVILSACANPQAAENYRSSGSPALPHAQAYNRCQAQSLQASYSAGPSFASQVVAQVQIMDYCMAGYGYYRQM